jgi:hypothetical protein
MKDAKIQAKLERQQQKEEQKLNEEQAKVSLSYYRQLMSNTRKP